MTTPACEYLATYGLSAYLGRFLAPADEPLTPQGRFVLRTPRGLELGTILCDTLPRFGKLAGPHITGEVVRLATDDDLTSVESLTDRARHLLDRANALIDELSLPLTVLDAEILLEGRDAILQAVHSGECDPTPLTDALDHEFGLRVWIEDLTETEAAGGGCGESGCGSGGCGSCGTSSGSGGCSSGSCSRGSVKDPDQLTEYFAEMRQKMDRRNGRTSLN